MDKTSFSNTLYSFPKIMSKENKDLCTLYEFVENNINEKLFKEKKIKLKSKNLFIIYKFCII